MMGLNGLVRSIEIAKRHWAVQRVQRPREELVEEFGRCEHGSGLLGVEFLGLVLGPFIRGVTARPVMVFTME